MRRQLLVTFFIVFTSSIALAQTDYDTSPSAQTGVQNFGSYFATDIDTVALFNRNLHLSIPLFSLPSRELPYGLKLAYNAQKWESDNIYYQGVGRYTGGWQKNNVFGKPLTASTGTSPSFWADGPYCFWNDNFAGGTWVVTYNVFWIDGEGTKHRYNQQIQAYDENGCISDPTPVAPADFNSRTLTSLDGDGSTLWTGTYNTNGNDPARINFKNGHILYFRTPTSIIAYDYVTPNGNYLIQSSDQSGLATHDTLGRSVGYVCTGCGSANWTETYTVTDSNNQAQTYSLSWSTTSSNNGITFVDPYQTNHPSVQLTILNSITLPNGKMYTFEYRNPQGMLTKVTLPSGAYTGYVYNTTAPQEQLTERHVSPDGTSEQVWQYSAGGTVTSPIGDKVVHTFNSNGQETATEWQTSSGTALKRVENTWDQDYIATNGQPANGRVTANKTYLNGTLYSTKNVLYDANMNVVREILAEGSGGTGTAKTQKDYTYITLTGNYSVPTLTTFTAIDPATSNFVQQGKTQYVYDEYSLTARSGVPNHTGNTSQTNRGNVTTIKRYRSSTDSNPVTDHVYYDSLGNVVENVDPLGHATYTFYDDNFCTLDASSSCTNTTAHSTFAYPTTVTNALSQSVTTKYDYNTGLPAVSTNLRGNSTKTKYDLMNRVASITEPPPDPNHTDQKKITTYSYDDTNRITTKEVTVDSSGNKGHVETSFDKLYRVTETRTNDPEGVIAVDTVYDGKGRKIQTSNPYRLNTESSVWTTTTYDATDRMLQVQAPDTSLVSYAYAFNQTTVTDEAGNQRRYTYNPWGQLTKVEEPNPTLSTPVTTTYKYYGFGPLYQSNQSNQLRTFVYDYLGRMASQTLPESGATTFLYDDAGRMTSKTDARNITTTIVYDNIHRVTNTTYSDGTPTVTYGYDANGFTGLKTSMSDSLSATNSPVTYSYDNMNRLTQESRTLAGVSGTFTTAYVYNIKGDVIQMTYPSGRVVNLVYNTGGGCCNSRLQTVSDATTNTTLSGGMTYNAAGEMLGNILGNGVTQSYTYNNRLQETGITAALSGATLMGLTYDYGTTTTNTGRVRSRTDNLQPEHSVNYVYDSVYRLSQADSQDTNWSIAWSFDTWGNRLTQTPQGVVAANVLAQTATYTNNRLQTSCFGHSGDCYDAAGNMINDGALPTPHNYTFNAENQITTTNGPGGYVTYGYDGEGHRIKKATSTETTYFFYGPGGIISEFTTSNAIAAATAAASADKCFYHTSDNLGSAVLVINSAGTVIENNRTLPYGEAWLATDSGATSTNDKKFTTYQRDSESGLDYAMDRYYGNAGGRFQSPDAGKVHQHIPASLNRYVYAGGDPINHIDRNGKDPWDDDLLQIPGPPDLDACLSDYASGGNDAFLDYCEEYYEGGGAIQGGGGGGQQAQRHVAFLQLKSDCIEMHNPYTGGPTRDRTYTAIGDNGQPIGATITEAVTYANTGKPATQIIRNPNSHSIAGSGVFNDQLGLSLYQKGVVYLNQTFRSSFGSDNNVPTFVSTPGGNFGTLAIRESAVWINGKKVYDVQFADGPGGSWDGGMWNKDGSPRLPLCP